MFDLRAARWRQRGRLRDELSRLASAPSLRRGAHLTGYREKPLILLLCYERPARAHLHRARESLERVALQEHYTPLPRERGPIQHREKELKIIRDYTVTNGRPCTRPGRRIAPSSTPVDCRPIL